ncbi:MAG: 16S rRNA (uracil(1498)-N(3))-methyltransferase [Candidatus Omnitrophica bacterium]|nr:16S rRNA (uracil(1498)-N(3))-methyltransferase [Candidatus Omnitrophota bacterium]
MHRVFVPPQSISFDRACVQGPRCHHLLRVLRLKEGAGLIVFDGRGSEYPGKLIRAEREWVEIELGPRREVSSGNTEIVLVQAVPRLSRMDWVIEKATELGVGRIHPVLSRRSVARPSSLGNKLARWRRIAVEASRQSGRTLIPELVEIEDFAFCVEHLSQEHPDTPKFLAHVGAEDFAAGLLQTAFEPQLPRVLCLAVGPEGDFTEEEIRKAQALGWRSVSLGPAVLRSETAAIALVGLASQLLYAKRE